MSQIVEALTDKAVTMFFQNRPEKALEFIDKALGYMPNEANLIVIKARILAAMGRLEDALKLANVAIAQEPLNDGIYHIKCQILMLAKQAEKALACLDEAIRLNPKEPEYYVYQSTINSVLGRYRLAKMQAARALKLNPNHPLATNAYAEALFYTGEIEEAKRMAQHAFRLEPNNHYTMASMGWLYLKSKEYDKALELFQSSLRLDPNFNFAKNGLYEALKAKKWVYRPFLEYRIFFEKLMTKIGRFQSVFGVLLALLWIIPNWYYPEYAVGFAPLLSLVLFLMFPETSILPISNFVLGLSSDCRYLGNQRFTLNSVLVVFCSLCALTGMGMYAFNHSNKYLAIAIFGIGMTDACASELTGKVKIMLVCAIFLAIFGVLGVHHSFVTDRLFNIFTILFVLFMVLFEFLEKGFSKSV